MARSLRGRHRRVLLRDVLDYQERTRRDRGPALDQLATEGEDTGLYDLTATPVRRGEPTAVAFPALLDTCVLYPAYLCDTLLRLAEADSYPHCGR
jgi:hypothetical protein